MACIDTRPKIAHTQNNEAGLTGDVGTPTVTRLCHLEGRSLLRGQHLVSLRRELVNSFITGIS